MRIILYMAISMMAQALPGQTIEFREPASSVATAYPYLYIDITDTKTTKPDLFYHLSANNSCEERTNRQAIKLRSHIILGPLMEGSYTVCIYQEKLDSKPMASHPFTVDQLNNPNF